MVPDKCIVLRQSMYVSPTKNLVPRILCRYSQTCLDSPLMILKPWGPTDRTEVCQDRETEPTL
jgi:hypothetical protein